MAPCVGSSPARMDVHESGDSGQVGGHGAGQERGRAVFSKVRFERSLAERGVHQADKEIPGRRNSMSKGMGLSLDCKALGMAGAQGMCGGRAGEENTGRARPVGEEPHTPFPQRWGFILQATGRPGRICGVEGSNQVCVLERSLWLRVEENGVEAGRQGGGCGQSREMTTVARPEPWQQQWGDFKLESLGPGCISGKAEEET